MKKLLQPWVVDGGGPESEDHLSRQGVGIPAQVIDKVIGAIQKPNEHLLILEILIRYIRSSSSDVEDVVYHLPDHSPCRTVLLNENISFQTITDGGYEYRGVNDRSMFDFRGCIP